LGVDAPPDVAIFREEIAPPTAAVEKDGLASLHRLRHAVRSWLNSCTSGLARLREQLAAGLNQQADASIATLAQEIDTFQRQLDDQRFQTPINAEPHMRPRNQEAGAAA
jgi:type VI protein secretion system component VasF